MFEWREETASPPADLTFQRRKRNKKTKKHLKRSDKHMTLGNTAHTHTSFSKFVRTHSNLEVETSQNMSGLPLKDRRRNPSVDTCCQLNSKMTQTWSSSPLDHKATLPEVYNDNTYLIKSVFKTR